MGGELNFILNHGELWGTTPRLDPLSDYFVNELERTGLIDLGPVEIEPTCVNNRERV